MGLPWKKPEEDKQQQEEQQQQREQQQQQEQQTATQTLTDTSNNDNNNNNNNNNGNSNVNGNVNANDNKNDNKNTVDNKLDNKTDNSVDNKVDNKVENTVDTKVNVDVKVDLDLSAKGLSAPVNDLHDMHDFSDSLIMPQSVNQTLSGGGNQFNIDQVNNLVNNGTVTDPNVTFNGGEHKEGGFQMDAKAWGGDAKVDDSKMGDVSGAAATGINAHADAAITQSAFNQTITLGANIQFNSMTITAAGHDLSDSSHHTG